MWSRFRHRTLPGEVTQCTCHDTTRTEYLKDRSPQPSGILLHIRRTVYNLHFPLPIFHPLYILENAQPSHIRTNQILTYDKHTQAAFLSATAYTNRRSRSTFTNCNSHDYKCHWASVRIEHMPLFKYTSGSFYVCSFVGVEGRGRYGRLQD